MSKPNILITGCSKGFGLLFAEKLASEGYNVYATVRNLAEALDLVSLSEKYANLEALELDVLNSVHIKRAAKLIDERDGKLTVLINNAGYGLLGRIEDLEADKIQHQFATNVFAPIAITQEFLPLLKKSPKGSLIINISSIASYLGLPSFGAYSATKAALNNISMALAAENAESGVSVAVIQPGPYKTKFRESTRESGDSNYLAAKTKNNIFSTAEEPYEVACLVSDLIKRKLENKLPSFSEIPIGANSNLLRLASRWLSQSMLAGFMVKRFAK